MLREKRCSLKEQIAGLLHDVSHTIFSHVGDWIFNHQNQEKDYQSLTHGDYLEESGLGNILRKHGYTTAEIQPTHDQFPALEQPLPDLCADRIDYNLQGAFYQGFITHEEAVRLFHEIQWMNGTWISHELELIKKLVRYSIFMSQDCWGSGTNYVLSMWLAEAILRGLDKNILSMEDIKFGIDQEVWERLLVSDDCLIQKNIHMILNNENFHRIVTAEEANLFIKSKFRGINPLVLVDGELVRITTQDPLLAEEFQTAEAKNAAGWTIKINSEAEYH